MKIGFEIIKLCKIQKLCLPLVGATVGVHDGLEVVGDKLGFDVVGFTLGTQIKISNAMIDPLMHTSFSRFLKTLIDDFPFWDYGLCHRESGEI